MDFMNLLLCIDLLGMKQLFFITKEQAFKLFKIGNTCRQNRNMIKKTVLTLYRTKKILDIAKLKACADYKLNVAKIVISLFDNKKTLWEKEKMLVSSIFSFSHSVFQNLSF